MNTQKLEKKIGKILREEIWCEYHHRHQIKTTAKAITQFIVGCVPEKMKGDGTGFEFTKQLAHNDCVNEMERRLTE